VTFVHRYAEDTSRPTGRQAWRDVARRSLAPAAGLWTAVVGIGALLVGPLGDPPAEDAAVRGIAEGRTPTLDTLTSIWSTIATTEAIIASCVVAIAILWWRTREWWYAAVFAVAVPIQTAVFLTAAAVVGRQRPEVEPLEIAPPTSSYPSGHTGAATAFYVTLALVCQRIEHPVLRRLATVACLLVPVLVAYARLYRGMHHPTDVVLGAVNGLVCAWLGWRYLRRDDRAGAPSPRR
jgi:membrane-associated phospholipid phosphatase